MDSTSNDSCVPARIEELGLSVRTRRVLRRQGCATAADVQRLDLGAPIRGLGPKSKEELLTRMQEAGMALRYSDATTEVAFVERSLKRIRRQMDVILAASVRDLRAAEEQIQRLKERGSRKLA